MPNHLLVADDGPVRTLTLNRPEARNALTAGLIRDLAAALAEADGSAEVAVVVLTGADPAFCAGLDLRELGSSAANLAAAGGEDDPWRMLRRMAAPVIGAVNGPAVTGGLELALGCDFLVASERAAFADTHARVGAMPGGGLTAMLPQAVGLRKALEMSLTGNFVDASEALRLRLVNEVVPHRELLPRAAELAAQIAGNDLEMVRRLKASYREGSLGSTADALEVERREFAAWRLDPAEVERRRAAITVRGREQAGG